LLACLWVCYPDRIASLVGVADKPERARRSRRHLRHREHQYGNGY
jgi:hypothetical protein